MAEWIGEAARNLNQLRSDWLNPPQWTEPIDSSCGPQGTHFVTAKAGFDVQLRERTLTNLYNNSPRWLHDAHRQLDNAVASAYGWADYEESMSENEIVSRLLPSITLEPRVDNARLPHS